jgi:arsenate reductase-like glutaredoxin family protein
MAQLTTKIKLYTNKEIDFLNEVKLKDDGNGAYIKEWNLNIPQPTQSQLDALENEANIYEQNLINNKQSALNKLSALGLTADEIKAIIG